MTSGPADQGHGQVRGIILYGKSNTVIMLGNAKDFPPFTQMTLFSTKRWRIPYSSSFTSLQLLALGISLNNPSTPVPLAWDFRQMKLWVCLPLFCG